MNRLFAVFDIEVLLNCFICCIYDVRNNQMITIEISPRRNDLELLRDIFTSQQYVFVGYNCIHYDTPVINCILKNYNRYMKSSVSQICSELHTLSSTIINGNALSWKQYKYANNFAQIDLLTMLFSQALRVSLKAMQVTMNYPNVQEMQVDWNKPIELDRIDELIGYCHNDVGSTTELLKRCKSEIQLRKDIKRDYNFECYSKDGVGIGADLLKREYAEQNNIDVRTILAPTLDYTHIQLKDCISPLIKYDDPILNGALERIKSGVIDITTKPKFTFDIIWQGGQYTYGLGGMHSVNKPEIVHSDEDYIIIDADVDSYYPSMIIEYGFYPKRYGESFLRIYKEKRDDRLAAKKLAKTDKAMALKSDVYKLLLNSTFGNMKNAYSWLYDPLAFYSITLTGQLAIMMLNEKLVKMGCIVVSSNTDGTTVKVPRAKVEEYYAICKEWSEYTKLGLEYAVYDSMYIYAVNDYIAVKEGYADAPDDKKAGYIKKKGVFLTEPRIGKGLDCLIIAKALVNYFVDKIPIEQTIIQSTNIWDFVRYEKTDKEFTVVWNNKRQQHTNRYFISRRGAYLYKGKFKETFNKKTGTTKNQFVPQHMLKGFGTQLFNKHYDVDDFKQYDIDYSYYMSRARDIIRDMEPQQMSLF